MGLFDWLLTDPTQSDGGFLARLLLDHKSDAASAASAAPAATSALTTGALPSGYGGLLGESPLVNLLRSGFAGMNAANGYAGFGPQFAAGVKGGSDAMALRRQQMLDQIDALKVKQAMAAKIGVPGAVDEAGPTARAQCPTCAGAPKVSDIEQPPQGGEPDRSGELPRVQSDADYEALPNGIRFLDPLGQVRVKP